MSINITDKTLCSGCTACQQICPKNSIKMVEDNEGFLYPQVDTSCVECGLCEKICPVINKSDSKEIPQESYILQIKDKEILKTSTSGGSLTPIAKEIIRDNGIVFGCAFDENFDVVHIGVEDEADLWKFRGSKYVQSYLGDTFSKVKEALKSKKVLFIGTPCQVEGLLAFLQKPYDNLFTVDFVCRGVPSPMIWRKQREYLTDKFNSPIKYACFREKTYGYNSGAIVVEFENGKKSVENTLTDYLEKSFFQGLIARPICFECPYKTAKRKSDLTVFDGWSYSALTGKADNNLGHTIAVVQSEKGREMLRKISNQFEMIEIDTEKALATDGKMMTACPPKHPRRVEYFEKINSGMSIDKVVAQIIPVKLIRRIFGKTKKLLYKTGVLSLLKKIKKSLRK